MSRASEQWSKASATSQGRTDANLANDSNNLGGIPAEDWATKQWVREYHDGKESDLGKYVDEQDQKMLDEAKEYANSLVRNQDFSGFAEIKDLQALNANLTEQITEGLTEQKNYTDSKTKAIVDDVNANFKDVENSISTLNGTVNNLFQSVSNGKGVIAEAITDKGVPTSATDSYSTMAGNIRAIPTGGTEIDPNFVNTSDGNATENDIRLGKTAYVKGQKVYGALIPEGIDTSDATATAEDIRNGKTAYVNGQKIYGTLYAEDGGDTGYEPNPDNPYPTLGVAELIYAENEAGFNTTFMKNLQSNNYAISADKRLLVLYDYDEKKIKTYIRGYSPDGYFQNVNASTGELITPEYTLADLGIPDNVTIGDINFGPMNTNTNESSYTTILSIATKTEPYTIYIFKVSTYDGKIKTENDLFQETTGYNRWIITPNNTNSNMSSSKVFWSPYSYVFAFYDGIYKLLNSTLGSGENYEKAYEYIEVQSGIEGAQFLNNNRVFQYSTRGSYSIEVHLAVLDKNLSVLNIEHGFNANMILTPDCLYGVNSGRDVYVFSIDYTTGKISTKNIGELSGSNIFFNWAVDTRCITTSNNYAICNSGSTVTIYRIDFKNLTLEIYTTISNISNMKPLQPFSTFSYLTSGNSLYLIEPIVTEKNVIGIKYNGEIFYSSSYKLGVLTARSEDVRAGKTFIGFNGVYETGTMEVTE